MRTLKEKVDKTQINLMINHITYVRQKDLTEVQIVTSTLNRMTDVCPDLDICDKIHLLYRLTTRLELVLRLNIDIEFQETKIYNIISYYKINYYKLTGKGLLTYCQKNNIIIEEEDLIEMIEDYNKIIDKFHN